jgi:hypothetical protein
MMLKIARTARRIAGFDGRGMVSIALWVARRRHGVPPGATAVAYSKEQTPLLLLMLFAMIVETVAVEALLRVIGAPAGVRAVVLVIDLYGVAIGLAVLAACVTRPHVVTAGELRVRYGAFFDLRVPRELISSVRLSRDYNASGMISVTNGRLAVAVSSQTNVVVELTEPVTAVRPLGRRAEVTAVRFFADDPGAVVTALRAAEEPQSSPAT